MVKHTGKHTTVRRLRRELGVGAGGGMFDFWTNLSYILGKPGQYRLPPPPQKKINKNETNRLSAKDI